MYYAADRPIPNLEFYIDWTLSEIDDQGFIFTKNSIAPIYSHMDGLQILVEYYTRSDYKKDIIKKAVERGLNNILIEDKFDQLWDVDLHQLLARCETISQALRILPDHSYNCENWNCIWDLKMWKISKRSLSFDVKDIKF